MTAQQTTNTADLIEQANAGNAQAQFELALRYLSKEFEAPELKPSLDWLIKSANAQNPKAQFTLALIYMLNKHEQIANIFLRYWVYEIVEWSKNNAHNFSEEKLFVYSVLRIKLDQQYSGITKSPDLDDETIRKARQKTLGFIQYCLGGFDVSLNDQLAIDWLKQASANHHPEAQFWLETCYPELDKEIPTEDGILTGLYQAYSVGKPGFPKHEGIADGCLNELSTSEDEDLAGEANYILACKCFKTEHVKAGISYLRDAIQCNHTRSKEFLENTFLKFAFPEFYRNADSEKFYCYAVNWLSSRILNDPYSAEVNFAIGVLSAFGKGTDKDNIKAINHFQLVVSCFEEPKEIKDDARDVSPNALAYFADIYLKVFCGKKSEFSISHNIKIYFSENNTEITPYVILPSLAINYYNENDRAKVDAFQATIKLRKKFESDENYLETIFNQNKENQKLQIRMQKLVEQFTHTLGNVIFPDTIYQVAERLKVNPKCRKDALLLNEAYHSEIIIKLQAELLRQRHTNINAEKFRQLIWSCRRLPESGDKIKSIDEILDYAASRVAARFLNQHNASLNSIRDKILSHNQVSLDVLKQKFEDDILLNQSLSAVAWIDRNLRPFKVEGISPLWQKVRILAESHAEALLFGHFSEALFNAFKYADHDASNFLTVEFSECVVEDQTYLKACFANPRGGSAASNELGTGKGLDAIKEDLRQLNDTCNDANSLAIEQDGKTFQVTMFFQENLLLHEGPMPKLKRKVTVE